MRKLFFLALAFACLSTSFATVIPAKPLPNAAEILIPVGKTGQKISLLELSRISTRELESLRGQKMGFFDRLNFKAAQKKLRNNIAPDGTLNNKKIANYLQQKKGGATGFHIGGFALGFFLGAIGIVIAYVINDDYKKNRVKWAWIGLGIYVALFVILLLTVDLNWGTY